MICACSITKLQNRIPLSRLIDEKATREHAKNKEHLSEQRLTKSKPRAVGELRVACSKLEAKSSQDACEPEPRTPNPCCHSFQPEIY